MDLLFTAGLIVGLVLGFFAGRGISVLIDRNESFLNELFRR